MMHMKILQTLYSFARRLPAEKSRKATLYGLAALSYKKAKKPDYPSLYQNLWGRDFYSPVGLAAGFDKNAVAVGGHFHLGFGFAEIGTVTPEPQLGNSLPRVFEDTKNGAIINRMGCPNVGLQVFGKRMAGYHLAYEDHWGVVGINFGVNAGTKNQTEDYRLGMQHVGALGDYVVLNMSSPNAQEVQGLLNPQTLSQVLETVMGEREKIETRLPALVVKISPDINFDDVPDICRVLKEYDVNGVILTNTTTTRPDYLDAGFAKEIGGLSGRPLAERSTALISAFYKELQKDIPIIGCGGIDSAQAAYEKICAGAHLVQLYTGFVQNGPVLIQQINQGLVDLLQKDGFENVTEAVGVIHRYRAEK